MGMMFPEYKKQYKRLLSLSNLNLHAYTDVKADLKHSLKRIRAFLKLLGSPEKKMQIIHVAGTSGKGSVVNMLREVLHADGRKVGAYLSPHTTSYVERFYISEELIDPNQLAKNIKDMLEVYEAFLKKNDIPLSFFELSTCLTFLSLERAGMDWCVLETGCGGRYDATNAIPTPRVAVITNIGKDHTELLGGTLAKIAKAKAGIIKKKGIVYCGETRPSLKKVFCKEAIKKDAALFFVSPPSKRLVFEELGAHQQHNAKLVEKVAQEIGIKADVIEKSLKTTLPLPCRFEMMQRKPRVILDGAHSPQKIKSTAALMKSLPKPVHVIFGCTASKDAEAMLKELSAVASRVSVTRFSTTFRKAALPNALLKLVPPGKRSGSFLRQEDALGHAMDRSKGRGTIVVTGSLYLAGEMRSKWISEEDILKNRSSFLK